ncbi:MAG: ASCH domain-containing protein [Clostridia bacterium]
MLTLPIEKKWFDMIESGEKKEEYREIKPYWTSRFENLTYFDFRKIFRDFEVEFRNGYGNRVPKIRCRCRLRIGIGKTEWGAEPNKEYYILEILEILEVQNVK